MTTNICKIKLEKYTIPILKRLCDKYNISYKSNSKKSELIKYLDDFLQELYDEHIKKYYTDVLDFLNLLFEDNSKNLTGLKFKKITLNQNVFTLYNEIIKIYKLKKAEFDADNYDVSEINETDEIKNIFYDITYK